jgi:hypothetical protein
LTREHLESRTQTLRGLGRASTMYAARRMTIQVGFLVMLLGGGVHGIPHDLTGRTATGAEYGIPHQVTYPGPNDREHTHVPDLTGAEKLALEAAARNLILQKKWTPDQIRKTSDATAQYDCHGLTFDSSNSFIDNKYAEDLARYQGYRPLRVCPQTSEPRVGDIVIYRKSGRVTHSGRVVGRNGQVIRVHSKWGYWPDYEHDIDKVPDAYGTPEFWRMCP